ncbi:ABC transporter ATP-binding protein [Chloroflexota bacterium]
MLTLKNVQAHYGGIQALKGISIEAEEGSITTLVGANGAGKSTCLCAISGLEQISAGEIIYNDKRIDGVSPQNILKMGISQVPERRGIFPRMSVYDNLMSGAYHRNDREGIARDIEKVYKYFPILKEKLRQMGKDLSGGQQQMLAIGRALLSNPKFLLLDEPSLGLAPLVVDELFCTIQEFAKSGYGVLLVEQNVNLALDVAQQAYVMELGNIVLQGEPGELRNNDHVRKAYLGI